MTDGSEVRLTLVGRQVVVEPVQDTLASPEALTARVSFVSVEQVIAMNDTVVD